MNCANIQIKDEGAIMDLYLKEAEKAYGCLFCITGKENLVANCIQIYNKDVRARAANQTMRHTYQGVTKLQNDVILKGYVFFETKADANIDGILPPNDILSVLRYSDGDWRLYGDDLEYAKWIFLKQAKKTFQAPPRVSSLIADFKSSTQNNIIALVLL